MKFDKETRNLLCIAYAQARLARKGLDALTPPNEEELNLFLRDYLEAQVNFDFC